jgi:hypothetical protein
MYLINPNNEYPRHIGDLLAEHPDWTETEPLPDGWIEVLPGELPLPTYKQFVRELPIAQNENGQWVRQFELADLPADQIPDDETMAEIMVIRARIEAENAPK